PRCSPPDRLRYAALARRQRYSARERAHAMCSSTRSSSGIQSPNSPPPCSRILSSAIESMPATSKESVAVIGRPAAMMWPLMKATSAAVTASVSSGGGAAIGSPKLRIWRAAGQDTNCRRTPLDTGLKGTTDGCYQRGQLLPVRRGAARDDEDRRSVAPAPAADAVLRQRPAPQPVRDRPVRPHGAALRHDREDLPQHRPVVSPLLPATRRARARDEGP